MMYNEKLVASIKANGKILREFKDTVYIPFSSEYSILLKNLNTVRALVHIYIDGNKITQNGLVLNARQTLDLERSITENLNEGNKFKFIERTSKIEAHRGSNIEDGIVRIEYQFEKITTPSYSIRSIIGSPWHDRDDSPRWTKGIASSLNSVAYTNEVGITVPGSKSDQSFTTVSGFTCNPEIHSIVLRLVGETKDNVPVNKPITVKSKPECKICGHLNKSTNKFCSDCGASLVIY